MYTILPISRLEHPGASDFERCAASGKPFVIEGAIAWKALEQWTPDYLMARAGSAKVPVLKVPEGGPDGKFAYGDSAGIVTFADCLPLLSGAPARVYGAGIPVAEYLPMLVDDLGELDFISTEMQKLRQLWISGRNSKWPLHYDLDDNIHVVVRGRKRFRLFDYAQTRHLYPFPMVSPTPHFAHVDAHEPDFERFPHLRQAHGYDVSLERGAMIYIPQGCWHQVLTEEPSVAINFWLGKRFFQRAMWRVLASLLVYVPMQAAAATWRSVSASRRRPTAVPH